MEHTQHTKAYRKASFRGISFHVEEASSEVGGRRHVLHEYAGKAEAYAEDLGQKAKSFSLQVYVLGKEHQKERDALIEACNKEGIGTLIHPYLGTLQVLCTGCSVSQSSSAVGLVNMSLSFVLVPTVQTPVAQQNTVSLAQEASSTFAVQAEDAFTRSYVPATLSSYTQGKLTFTLTKIANILNATNKEIASLHPSNITHFIKKHTLFRSVRNSIATIERISALLETKRNNSKKEIETVQYTNTIVCLACRITLSQAVTEACTMEYTSSAEAKEVFTSIDVQIENALGIASQNQEDELFFVLQDMRCAFVEHIQKTAVQLPHIHTVLVSVTTPSLRVAFEETGNANNTLDFDSRNNIPHPAFVLGGQRYEVLKEFTNE